MVKVYVKEAHVISVKPKVTKVVLKYVIVTENELGMVETIWVDADKFDKEKVELAIKQRHAARLGIPSKDIHVEWLIEIPKIRKV